MQYNRGVGSLGGKGCIKTCGVRYQVPIKKVPVGSFGGGDKELAAVVVPVR